MFASDDWVSSPHASKSEGKQVADMVFTDSRFWSSIKYCLRCVVPLVKVLRLVDGDSKPAMPYIYEAMDRAKEEIAQNFQNKEQKYKVWKIIDTHWNLQLHRPLHAAAYYLNPKFHYDKKFAADGEVYFGLYETIEKMVPDRRTRLKLINNLKHSSLLRVFLEGAWQQILETKSSLVLIMKTVEHPNIVNLIEVIDDPESDHFYMVLEYVEGKWVCEGTGPRCGLCEETARRYLRDIVSGLMYLHAHNIVHGDIKPDNLLVTRHGTVKIGDFSVSQALEDDNDELRRSPGTPVFTAPECCLGLSYHGKAADTWAVGVTLYCMILGEYPFLGDTLPDTYDKIVNNPLVLPDNLNLQLKNLLEGLLCKDPKLRLTLGDVAKHSWVIGDDGPIPEYLCCCKRKRLEREDLDGSNIHA